MTTAAGCLRMTSGPFLVICLLAWAAVRAQPTMTGIGEGMASTSALWLHLPAILLAAIAIAAPLESWPLLSRDRPGNKQLRRLQVGPLQGCGMVAVASLLVLALTLSAAAVLFHWQMQNLGHSRAVHAISSAIASPEDQELALGPNQRSLRFSLEMDFIAGSLELRPLALLSARGSYRRTGIQILADGQILNQVPLQVEGSAELLSLNFAPRKLRDLEIRIADLGDIQVKFLPGSILAISAESYPSILNCLLAALSYLFPASLALASLCLLRTALSLPMALALALVVLLTCTLGGFTPNGLAIGAYSRGLWIPSAGLSRSSLASLAMLGGLLLAAALIPGRGLR